MKVWWCLFCKEFRLMRHFLIVNGLALSVAGIIGIYAAARYHSGIPSLIMFMAMVWHLVYLIVYMIKSLKRERRNAPIWLQSPQASWVLLSSKGAAGLSMMCSSLAVCLMLWFVLVQLDFFTGSYEGALGFRFLLAIDHSIKMQPGLIILIFVQHALFIAALGTFVYFIVDSSKYYLRRWRWILFPITFIIMLQLVFRFADTALYPLLFHWGVFHFSPLALDIPHNDPHFSENLRNWLDRPHYWGDIVYRFLIIGIWAYISGWLLDRKAEV